MPSSEKLIRAFQSKVQPTEPTYRSVARADEDIQDKLRDSIFALPGDQHTPSEVFDKLRWGGEFVCISKDVNQIRQLSQQYNTDAGFNIDHSDGTFKTGFFLFPSKYHFFVARKVYLIPPGEITNRFTFNVRLYKKKSGEYVVSKQVPDFKSVYRRLKDKFPDVDNEVLTNRSRKLCDRVFPVFLSRETAFLQLLQRDLPETYRKRVPKVLAVEKGEDGLVRKMHLNWMRQGCEPLSHLEFARQSADLLRVLHDVVGIIHLDLRLDNFIITKDGVCFVDFGSAVRVGEQLSDSPMLQSLFDEMMSTSKIQKQLGQMIQSGKVTSSHIIGAHQRVDKAIDLFYLALQMKKPLANPDFIGLVNYDPNAPITRQIADLTQRVLRPDEPSSSPYQTAADVVQGIKNIEKRGK